MNRRKELLWLVLGDFISLNLAWFVFFWIRVDSSWFFFRRTGDLSASLLPQTSLILYAFWMVLFLIFGLYRPWYVRAQFDEIVTLLKTLTVGTVVLSVVLWWDPTETSVPMRNDPRVLAALYWIVICGLCIGVRSLIRYVQRRLLEAGLGVLPSLIIGDVEKSRELARKVVHYPRLGYQVVGYVQPMNGSAVVDGPTFSIEVRGRHHRATVQTVPYLGTTAELEEVIESKGIREVLITLGTTEHEKLIDVITRASKSNAGLKIVPDLYDIVSGQARAREIHGFPLIDINPVLLRPWEAAAKRTLDIVLSAIVLVVGLPIWILVALSVKLSSKGPLIYAQDRVGKDGVVFRIYKFRSMRVDAERSGPTWATKKDPRATPVGQVLRDLHLDEVPQFWNVLRGDMSLVGPRPERPYFVEQLIQEIPYYNRRHKVRPGITGFSQAMRDFPDADLDDVRQKLKYDLMYIESMSFRLEMKILFRTAFEILRGFIFKKSR